MRALHEDASLAGHMARRADASGSRHTAERFAQRQRLAERHARVLEELMARPQDPDSVSPA